MPGNALPICGRSPRALILTLTSDKERMTAMAEPSQQQPSARSAYGATWSLPRTPAKVSSPSDLQTFAIVHCKTGFC
jgi:hypothetical protein